MNENDIGLLDKLEEYIHAFAADQKDLWSYVRVPFKTKEQKECYEEQSINYLCGYLLLFTFGFLGAHRLYIKSPWYWPYLVILPLQIPDAAYIMLFFCAIDFFLLPLSIFYSNLKLKRMLISNQAPQKTAGFYNQSSYSAFIVLYFVWLFTWAYIYREKFDLLMFWDMYIKWCFGGN